MYFFFDVIWYFVYVVVMKLFVFWGVSFMLVVVWVIDFFF